MANVRYGRDKAIWAGKCVWAWRDHMGGASVKMGGASICRRGMLHGRDKCMWAGHAPVGGASVRNGRGEATERGRRMWAGRDRVGGA